MPRMRIAIYGVGGVGGYFGGHLALAGADVVFLARGEHLAALRRDGLTLELPGATRVARPVSAVADPAEAGPVDVVLLAVKTWQVADAARAMAPMLGPETFVVPLQNGVESPSELAAVLGAERVVGGLCGTISWIVAPGRVRSLGSTHFLRFGELDRRRTGRCERLRDALVAAGVRAEIPDDIEVAMWEKFLFVVPFGGVGAAADMPIGVLRSLPETRALIARAMREIEAVARARGVALAPDRVERSLAGGDALSPEGTTSMHRDLLAGRPSELEAWTGAVVRLGAAAGVPTPIHDVLYRVLLPRELAARGRLADLPRGAAGDVPAQI